MKNTKKDFISIDEASANFKKAAKLASENGTAKILVDGMPKYVLVDTDKSNFIDDLTDDELIDVVSKRILTRHRRVFEELAK